jgi:hypothetical protein
MQAYPLLHTVSGPPRLLHAPGAVLCDCFNPAVALDKPLEFEGVAITYGGLLKTEPSAKTFKVINTQVLKWPAAINPVPRWPYMKLVEAYNNDFFCEPPRLEAFFDAIEHYKAWCKEYHTVCQIIRLVFAHRIPQVQLSAVHQSSMSLLCYTFQING